MPYTLNNVVTDKSMFSSDMIETLIHYYDTIRLKHEKHNFQKLNRKIDHNLNKSERVFKINF